MGTRLTQAFGTTPAQRRLLWGAALLLLLVSWLRWKRWESAPPPPALPSTEQTRLDGIFYPSTPAQAP